MKSNKIYIVGGICFLVGLLIFFIGYVLTGFNINKLNNTRYTKKTIELNNNINSININEKENNVKVISSSDDKIHLTYYKSDYDIYNIKNKDNIFSLKSSYKKFKKNKWYENINVNINFHSINTTTIIEIPGSYKGNLNIKTDGKLNVDNIASAKITLKNKYEDISVNNIKATELSIKSIDTSMKITNINVSNNMNVSNSNGDVSLSNIKSNNINVINKYAKIDLKNTTINSNAYLKTSDADIILNNLSVGNSLTCKNSNGNIKGTINDNIKNFNINSKATNARNNLPEKLKLGSKRLDVSTSNADIDIKFKN